MKANRIHKSRFARLRRKVTKLVKNCKFYKASSEEKKRKANEKKLRHKMVKDV